VPLSRDAVENEIALARSESVSVDLVVLDQAIDTTTPAGRLLFYMLAAIAEFERDLIRERVMAGVRRARTLGKHLGRPRVHQVDVGGVTISYCVTIYLLYDLVGQHETAP